MADKEPRFELESELCAAFIEAAKRDRYSGWRFFAETAGWDILAVRADGAQVGIEAKLRLNNKVVAQALPERYSHGVVGPDFRAVLVPGYACENDLAPICHALGITVISLRRDRNSRFPFFFSPSLPGDRNGPFYDWHEWAPVKRHVLPDYVPDVAAGASAPVQLTHWKIQAIKLAVLLETRPITRSDFRSAGVDPGRWTEARLGWLTKTPEGYVAGPHMPDFAAQHPTNYAQIKADRAKWDWVKSPLLAAG
jgi:hypothetical protein